MTRSAIAFPQISLDLFNKEAQRYELKSKILSLASQTQRGLTATDAQKEEMEQLFMQHKKLNPTPNPLVGGKNKASVDGDRDLRYTTSHL